MALIWTCNRELRHLVSSSRLLHPGGEHPTKPLEVMFLVIVRMVLEMMAIPLALVVMILKMAVRILKMMMMLILVAMISMLVMGAQRMRF